MLDRLVSDGGGLFGGGGTALERNLTAMFILQLPESNVADWSLSPIALCMHTHIYTLTHSLPPDDTLERMKVCNEP